MLPLTSSVKTFCRYISFISVRGGSAILHLLHVEEKNHTSRSRYHANSDSSFHQTRLFTSDVSLNPGPLTTSGPNSTQNQKESFNCGLSCVSPHVRESRTFLNSGFHAVDSGFRVLDSGFQHSGFRIPKRAGFQFFTVLMLFFAFRFRVRILLNWETLLECMTSLFSFSIYKLRVECITVP